jgi:hypothetical protein
MDEVLMNYLPNAFAFIYVFDISHAGGLQQDLKEKVSIYTSLITCGELSYQRFHWLIKIAALSVKSLLRAQHSSDFLLTEVWH